MKVSDLALFSFESIASLMMPLAGPFVKGHRALKLELDQIIVYERRKKKKNWWNFEVFIDRSPDHVSKPPDP